MTFWDFCAPFYDLAENRSPVHPRPAAADKLLDLGERGHGRVARSRHRERPVAAPYSTALAASPKVIMP